MAKLSDITENVIPFFDKYPLIGSKAKDYKDFKTVAKLMRSKAHLTEEGLEEIAKNKSEMNFSREHLLSSFIFFFLFFINTLIIT